jgi:hypothetical protein
MGYIAILNELEDTQALQKIFLKPDYFKPTIED